MYLYSSLNNIKKRFSIILFSLAVLISGNIFPQNLQYNKIVFERLSIENGLSQITVHSILKDSKGFLWFGTEDGLNRYDGNNFVIYQNDINDTNSISDNFVWSLFEDSEKNIWIGTNGGGLNRYSYETNSFTHYNKESLNKSFNVRVIFEDSKKRLWIGTNNSGILLFDKNNLTFSSVPLGRSTDLSIRAICEDSNKVLWVGTENNGLFKKDKNSFHNLKLENFPNDFSVWALESDNENYLWIGTYNFGLTKLNLTNYKLTTFISADNKNSIANNNITSIAQDKNNNFWIATENGLSIYDPNHDTFINYRQSLSDLQSISNNFLRKVYVDDDNLIWIGTVGGGVNKVNLNRKFTHFKHNPSNPNSLSQNMIRAIEEDSFGNIWIGTLGNGLSRYEKRKNKFTSFNKDNSDLSGEIVTSIAEDSEKNLWIGTWGNGVNKFKLLRSGDIELVDKFYAKSKVLPITSDIVQDIYEDSNGNLWIGTEAGLNIYYPKKNIIERVLANLKDSNSISDNRIQSKCIVEDRFGYMWIGTWNGLNRVKLGPALEERKINKLYKNNGLSDNRIISIAEGLYDSSKGLNTIWVGTIGGGLNRLTYDPKDENLDVLFIENYSQKDGLPSNVIYGILIDNNNTLWMSTNHGLSNFNPFTHKFTNYDVNDGLQSNQFFWGAYHKTREGELYFGGINGLNSFYPDKLQPNKKIPRLFITKVNFLSSDSKTSITVDNIYEITNTKNVELPYGTYRVKFELAALDYTTPIKNLYKAKLEGYDNSVIELANKNTITYSNIQEGEYVFNFWGSNNDGLWNEKPASFQFTIETPFWKTWWFIIAVVVALGLAIFYLVFTQIKNVLAIERLRTKLAADLHDNIGSSLTEISILTEVISTKITNKDEEVRKYLNKISQKSRTLIDKMSDIVWLVNPQRDSLYDLILRLQDTYSDLLADTSISFTCHNLKSLEKVSLSMEHRQHLFLIFKEAINNSITHSNCSEIYLDASVSGKSLRMTLRDNGNGFDNINKSQGNGLKNMKDRAAKIGGNLTIKSSKDNGTVIHYFGYIH